MIRNGITINDTQYFAIAIFLSFSIILEMELRRFRRHRWNLARVDYCELERLDDEGTQSDQIVLSSPLPSTPGTDQDTIGWDHFIRGRISISFTPIVATYFRIKKLGRRFTTKKWFTAVIAFLFEIHQQAWLEFCSTSTRTSSTNKIASPKKKLS